MWDRDTKPTKESGWLKAVNSQVKPIYGTAHNVDLQVGTWKGKVNLSVVPMDDFQVVLGMEFFRQVKAVPMAFANSLCIMEEKSPCMVPTVQGTKDVPGMLSAMQLAKGFKKGEPTYLAAMKLELEEAPKEETPKGGPTRVPGCDASRATKEASTKARGGSQDRIGTRGLPRPLIGWHLLN